MSFTLHGIPVSKGIAIGRAYLISADAIEVDHYLVDEENINAEIERFSDAHQSVLDELTNLRKNSTDETPDEIDAIIHVHILLLRDAALSDAVVEIIRERHYNAEWALTHQVTLLLKHFDEIEDEYLRERRADIRQVAQRLLKALAGLPTASKIIAEKQIDHTMIVVADDIAPADMLQFRQQRFGGFITALGGKTSHTAIVARSLVIPATVGVSQACKLLRDDDLIIIDGDSGVVIVNPSAQIHEEYKCRQSEGQLAERKLNRLKSIPTQTLDGYPITLLANIELPEDAQAAHVVGADGIGLFRTEFLFMNKEKLPDENEQLQAYMQVISSMSGRCVTIRTIDVGADKTINSNHDITNSHADSNPALGLRAVRWCLSEPQMFLTQLRAILRASAHGHVRILIPMMVHATEIDQTIHLIELAKQQCSAAGWAFDQQIKIGAMIEVPAAALALPLFINRLDFLSIGTNDLIQYTLAIDRADHAVAHLYDPMHPAILHLIAHIITQANAVQKPVALCGEMAGDPNFTRLLLGLGLTEFSVHASQLLVIKREIIGANRKQLETLTKRLLNSFEPNAIQSVLASLQVAK